MTPIAGRPPKTDTGEYIQLVVGRGASGNRTPQRRTDSEKIQTHDLNYGQTILKLLTLLLKLKVLNSAPWLVLMCLSTVSYSIHLMTFQCTASSWFHQNYFSWECMMQKINVTYLYAWFLSCQIKTDSSYIPLKLFYISCSFICISSRREFVCMDLICGSILIDELVKL